MIINLKDLAQIELKININILIINKISSKYFINIT